MMTRWEYRQSRDFAELTALGQAGWELVAALPAIAAAATIFYLKRPVPGWRERITGEQKQRYYGQQGITPAAGRQP